MPCMLLNFEKLGCYKSNPLKMNLALEIRFGQQIGVGGLLEARLHAPMLLPLPCDDSTEPCRT